MRLIDIHVPVSFDFWVEINDKSDAESVQKDGHPLLGTMLPGRYPNEYQLRLGQTLMWVTLRDHAVANDLNFYLARATAHLIEVQLNSVGRQIKIHIAFFNGELIELGSVEVALDNHILDFARKKGIQARNIELLAETLAQRTILTVGDQCYFAMTTGAANVADYLEEEDDDEDELEVYPAFSIYGAQIRIPVERVLRSADVGDEIYFAKKLIIKDRRREDGAIRLVRGTLSFQDYTRTGKMSTLAAGTMQRLIQDEGSYLKKWDEYGAIEGELLLTRAREIGRIDYDPGAIEQLNGKVKFLNLNLPKGLVEGDTLDIVMQSPPYLTNPDMAWEDYSQLITEQAAQRNSNKKPAAEDQDDPSSTEPVDRAKIVEISASSFTLDIPIFEGQVGDQACFFTLSIAGEKVQVERRMSARKAILEGRSANPLLGLLIEENGFIPGIQRSTHLAALTPFVRKKIFKNDPTEKQIEAIRVALNTPDIALIQGPPGTGKTTVITAIIERLNEEHDKSRSVRGEILISGFQHDAVENVIGRLSINDLPSVKFGKRSIDSEFSESAVTLKLNDWCESLATRIRAKTPAVQQSDHQRRLAEQFASYALSPSQQHACTLLSSILALPVQEISIELKLRAEEILLELQAQSADDGLSSLHLIRGLRETEDGFVDDGADRALEVVERFEQYLSDGERALIQRASLWQQGEPLTFLAGLQQIKKNLLLRFSPRPHFKQEKPRSDILALITQLSKQMAATQLQQDQRSVILADFLYELEHNPAAARTAIADYNFVYSATVQQAEGKDIRRAKKKGASDELLHYDTVIIDEAARTSPRDLMIPMAQARKRIILVGDHRQLPHVLDDEVVRLMESGATVDCNQAFIEKSMFEYLFHRLKKLEAQDGISRTVTLNSQYRTHPVLGKFASECFYAAYDEGYDSPLPASVFSQNLANTAGKPALWICVPHQRGSASKSGTSWKRDIEANIIAEQIKNWIDTDEGKHLSFGVISFYKAQVNAVFQALSRYGITEWVDDRWQCTEPYRLLKKTHDGKTTIEERLRIGTVDGFQGMEFDVVLLSMVRTQKHLNFGQMDQKQQRGVFGHLMSVNRLCVSMTRQKRLLVVVGDDALIQTPLALSAVPALSKYYQLCAEQGVLL